MRIFGFCMHCRKPAQVRVDHHTTVRKIPIGTCAACEERLEKEAKKKWNRGINVVKSLYSRRLQ